MVKNPPEIQETPVQFLGQEDLLEKGYPHQCRGYKRCRFDPWVEKIPWRRAWQPTPVFLPGESHGQKSLVGYGLGHKELDMTEAVHQQQHVAWRVDMKRIRA